jgi:rod shape-determining protein MreD
MNKLISNTLRFFILIFVQVFMLKNTITYGLNVPYLYILFILLLPFETPNWLLFLLAFTMGISIDLFNDTLGLHAISCTILALFRILLISITVQKDNYDHDPEPSLGLMGFRWFFLYVLILTFIHHFFLLNIEVFRISETSTTLIRVILSSLFTVVLIFVSELLFFKKKQRK